MNTPAAPPWWHRQQDDLRIAAATQDDPSFLEHLLFDQLLALLDEVEDAFATTGASTPGWPDPHEGTCGQLRDSREEEYGRCLEPGKHRILWTRAEAWAQVLTGRGWAEREDLAAGDLRSGLRWADPPLLVLHRTTVLRPRRPGAQVLVLARTAPDDTSGSTDQRDTDVAIPGLVIGIGDPAVSAQIIPVCGCDACDDGSAPLLEELDRTILSTVDGSLEVVVAPAGQGLRASFDAPGGSGVGEGGTPRRISARSCADGWEPRPLTPSPAPRGQPGSPRSPQ